MNALPHPKDMLSLAGELNRLAEAIADMAGNQLPIIAVSAQDRALADFAQTIVQGRRQIGQHFDHSLFADPARDILLDLFIARAQNRRIMVSSCCIAAGVPSTTALRWLRTLEKRGHIETDTDSRDARRRYVRLSDRAYADMGAYVSATRDRVIKSLSN